MQRMGFDPQQKKRTKDPWGIMVRAGQKAMQCHTGRKVKLAPRLHQASPLPLVTGFAPPLHRSSATHTHTHTQ